MKRHIYVMTLAWAMTAVAVTSAYSAAPPTPDALADAVRGGWVADLEGVRHIFILKVVGDAVTGIYCPADCRDPANLNFVDDGSLTDGDLRFRILHLENDGTTSSTPVSGTFAEGELRLATSAAPNPAGFPTTLTLHRDPRRPNTPPVGEVFKRRGITSGPLVISATPDPYVPPGPNETITPAVLEGLWLWSYGPEAQHFMFRQVGDSMLGAVCGPCDNPYTFGPLDNFVFDGDTVTFDIVHQDWGLGIEYGPHANHATATLSHHELRVQTVQNPGTYTIKGDLILTGPIVVPRP